MNGVGEFVKAMDHDKWGKTEEPADLEKQALRPPLELASVYDLTPGQYHDLEEIAPEFRAAALRWMKGWKRRRP